MTMELADELGLMIPWEFGEYSGLGPMDPDMLSGPPSGFERVLEKDKIELFNDALKGGRIHVVRWRVMKP